MTPEIERQNCSIVLLGSFNPAIFHPAWFNLKGLISDEVADNALIDVVHPELAVLNLGTIRIDTQRTRFHIQTDIAPEIAILDFVLKLFGDLLPHTQVTQLGINKHVHFRTSSMEKRVRLGRLFAPTQPWGAFGSRIDGASGTLTGGMTNVSMREVLEDKEWSGHIEAQLSPSYDLSRETGVQININNHFALLNYEQGEGASRSLSILQEMFENRLSAADEIITSILEQAQ